MESKIKYLLCCCQRDNELRFQEYCLTQVQFQLKERGEMEVKIKRDVKTSDIKNISLALKDGWVITFQGTTTPFKPIREVTSYKTI